MVVWLNISLQQAITEEEKKEQKKIKEEEKGSKNEMKDAGIIYF